VSVDAVQVWLIGADLPVPVLGELTALLDGDERRRCDAIRGDRSRRRFIAAHGAARLILAERLAAPPGEIRWRRGEHGKPEIARPRTGLRVNLSHSGDLVMVAVTDRRPVGVDVEELDRHLDAPRLAARYFTEVEARFVAEADTTAARVDRFARLWVRKEACVKAAGGRLLQGMTLAVASAGTAVLVRDPIGPLPGPHLVRDVPAPPGFRAAVALAGARPYRVTRHRWWPGAGSSGQPGHELGIRRPVLVRNTSSRLGR
jgi:4'-phosphopantetheinyl transferase